MTDIESQIMVLYRQHQYILNETIQSHKEYANTYINMIENKIASGIQLTDRMKFAKMIYDQFQKSDKPEDYLAWFYDNYGYFPGATRDELSQAFRIPTVLLKNQAAVMYQKASGNSVNQNELNKIMNPEGNQAIKQAKLMSEIYKDAKVLNIKPFFLDPYKILDINGNQ